MKITNLSIATLALGLSALAQEPEAAEPAPQPATRTAETRAPEATETDDPGAFASAATDLKRKLEQSLADLDALRDRLIEEKVPLSKELRALENRLRDVRARYQETSNELEQSRLDLGEAKGDIQDLEDEAAYLSGLLGDYIKSFDSLLHIAELQRYGDAVEAARLAPQNENLSTQEIYAEQVKVVDLSLDRLFEALGGTRFQGTAVDGDGLVNEGTFALVGPAALFRAGDAPVAGAAEERIGSIEPTELAFDDPADGRAAAQLIATGEGFFPLDTTLGTAHKVASTDKTLLEEFEDGGEVMYPIIAMAGLALLVALYKWLSMAFLRRPSRKKVEALLFSVGRKDFEEAEQRAAPMKGPLGRMLRTAVDHIREPRELVEEVMYETVLTTKLKLQGLLPFIAISAASAPLMGLLGTVTGIINTFKMITVQGSGDVKSLSGGISEALITTKFGLIVAIPSLLLHAFLSRKAKRVVDDMEKTAIAFVNQLSKGRGRSETPSPNGAPKPAPPTGAKDVSAPRTTPPKVAPAPPSDPAHAGPVETVDTGNTGLGPASPGRAAPTSGASTAPARESAPAADRETVREQVHEILNDLLTPVVKQKLGQSSGSGSVPARSTTE